MAEFAYNNGKNASTDYMPFKLNCGYYSCVSYEEKKIFNPYSKSKTAEELSFKLQELMIVCQQNLYHVQKLQKQAHNKSIKPQSYVSGDKV